MFNELKSTFAKLHKLTWDARRTSRQGEITFSNVADLLKKGFEKSNEEKALFDFLNELDFETIKIIQTIMYLGRRRMGKENEKDIPKEEAYKAIRQILDQQGWEGKENEIHYIIEKAPLYQYLKNGFEALNILL